MRGTRLGVAPGLCHQLCSPVLCRHASGPCADEADAVAAVTAVAKGLDVLPTIHADGSSELEATASGGWCRAGWGRGAGLAGWGAGSCYWHRGPLGWRWCKGLALGEGAARVKSTSPSSPACLPIPPAYPYAMLPCFCRRAQHAGQPFRGACLLARPVCVLAARRRRAAPRRSWPAAAVAGLR